MKKFLTVLMVLFIGGLAFAERPPMYAGMIMGFDYYHYNDWFDYGMGSFGIEPHFGIRPISANRNMAFEAALKHAFKRTKKEDGMKLEGSCTAFIPRFMYDFKPLEQMNKLNFFVGGGIGIESVKLKAYGDSSGGNSYYSYGIDWSVEGKDTFVFFETDAGARYQIRDFLEAEARTEIGLGKLMSFSLSAGVNFKF